MSDRVLFPLMGLVAVLMIALALVWPQGLGARSPAPFGHALAQKSPAAAPSVAAPMPNMLSLEPPSKSAASSGASK